MKKKLEISRPRVVFQRLPIWKIQNVKTLEGTGFPTKEDAEIEMRKHQIINRYIFGEGGLAGAGYNAKNVADAYHDLARRMAADPEFVREIFKE